MLATAVEVLVPPAVAELEPALVGTLLDVAVGLAWTVAATTSPISRVTLAVTDLDPLVFLRDKTDEELLEELLPFGFIDRGTDQPELVSPEQRPPVRDLTAELLRSFDFDVEITPGPSWLR